MCTLTPTPTASIALFLGRYLSGAALKLFVLVGDPPTDPDMLYLMACLGRYTRYADTMEAPTTDHVIPLLACTREAYADVQPELERGTVRYAN